MRRGTVMPANVNPGFLPRPFVLCLAQSYKALPHLLPITAETSPLINLARTNNGKAFLESEAEWILLIDSDMTWEPDAIIRMLKTAKETKAKAVSGLTFMEQKGRVIPHAYALIPNKAKADDFVLAPYAVLPSLTEPFTVEAVGGACFLVHRDVYEDVRRLTQGTTAYFWQEEQYSPKNDAMKGEDLVFCERIKACGYDIVYEPRAYFPHLSKGKFTGLQEYVNFLDVAGIEHGFVYPPDKR